MGSSEITAATEYHIYRTQVTALIPEPSTLMLLGIGIVGLVGYGWRRFRS